MWFRREARFAATDHRLASSSKLSYHEDPEETLDDSGTNHMKPPGREEGRRVLRAGAGRPRGAQGLESPASPGRLPPVGREGPRGGFRGLFCYKEY